MSELLKVDRTILVIDDQIGIPGGLQQKSFLRNYGNLPYNFLFETCQDEKGTYNVSKALEAVRREEEVSLVLLDLKFGERDELLGIPILKMLVSRWAGLPVLIMSAADREVDLLGACLEEGAMGFVEKYKSSEYLNTSIERALGLMRSHVLLGQSAPLRALRRQAARLSPYDQIPVLIVGERGTGKERVARYIHQNGPRRQGPFVAVNCGGVPEALFESEFFGAEKGAFSGANRRIIGCLERAHGGTLFLDEVGTLPVSMQVKLLRVLQERTFSRLGSGAEEQRSNFQLLSATNANLAQLVQESELREDFLDRIAAVTIHTPPLRDCLEDLPLLAEHFLGRIEASSRTISSDALKQLSTYPWPGNVRELQRCIQEALVRSEGASTLESSHFAEKYLAVSDKSDDRSSQNPEHMDERPSVRRLRLELELANQIKKDVQSRKGNRWKAEFMRILYPHSCVQNAKGFSDVIKRWTSAPWGDPELREHPLLGVLLEELENAGEQEKHNE